MEWIEKMNPGNAMVAGVVIGVFGLLAIQKVVETVVEALKSLWNDDKGK